MKFVILAALAAVAVAAPKPDYAQSSHESVEVIPILKDVRVHEEDGSYNFDLETGNGIVLSQAGTPTGPDGSVVKAGSYSYTAPDGTPVHVKFVADENGYQPQSDLLPVAPAFPHPIPQFVLDQIAFAAAEDAARARGELSAESSEDGPSFSYGAP
ncbi:cuticle protein AMP1A-like [Homarus americanus]|uniref:cuticle protein AMP1A-like n=1 Tax=Homarus americanus TaxID=6706 RepID=UPI001C4603C5|nr:cuticle protein AMP1A-like [Homarus americanus]